MTEIKQVIDSIQLLELTLRLLISSFLLCCNTCRIIEKVNGFKTLFGSVLSSSIFLLLAFKAFPVWKQARAFETCRLFFNFLVFHTRSFLVFLGAYFLLRLGALLGCTWWLFFSVIFLSWDSTLSKFAAMVLRHSAITSMITEMIKETGSKISLKFTNVWSLIWVQNKQSIEFLQKWPQYIALHVRF